jgi:hypothetical protein
MPITKSIRIQYPDAQNKQSYIDSLIEKYRQKYDPSHISDKQIAIPVNNVVSLVSAAIESSAKANMKLLKCRVMQQFVNEPDFAIHHKEILESDNYYRTLYCYQNGMRNAPSILLRSQGVSFPAEEHLAEYLQFTSQMSKEVILGITQATEGFINKKQNQIAKQVSFKSPFLEEFARAQAPSEIEPAEIVKNSEPAAADPKEQPSH